MPTASEDANAHAASAVSAPANARDGTADNAGSTGGAESRAVVDRSARAMVGDASGANTANTNIARSVANTNITPSVQDCEAALEALDSCVACVEGVELQAEYEAGVTAREESLHDLTEEEVALVRLQIMEREEELRRGAEGAADNGQADGGGPRAYNRAATDVSVGDGEPAICRMVDDMNLCGSDMVEDAAELLRAHSFVDARSEAAGGGDDAVGAAPPNAGDRSVSGTPATKSADETGEVGVATAESPDAMATGRGGAGNGAGSAKNDASSPASSTASGASASPSRSLQCAICFDEASFTPPSSPSPTEGDGSGGNAASAVKFAYLPCCGSDGREATSTTKVCTACILLLSTPTGDGTARIGRCPRCRSWISVTTEGGSPASAATADRTGPPSPASASTVTVRAVTSAGKCMVCNQIKEHLVDSSGSVPTCDACYLGRRRPLLYECQQCHGAQRIPHPMYRYQPAVDEHGGTSWACHGRCRNFTMWRILPDQVRYIPPGDIPESWGEDYLEVARARVREARRGIVAWGGEAHAEEGGDGSYGCTLC